MSACERIAERLDGYRDGELGFLSRWRVERHVAGCRECQQHFEALGRTGDWVRQAALASAAAGAAPDFWPGIALRLPALDAGRRGEAEAAQTASPGRFAPGLFGPVLGGALAAAAAVLLWVAVPTSEPAANGVVRALYSQGRSVVVFEEEGADTIIWVMDERAGVDREGVHRDGAENDRVSV